MVPIFFLMAAFIPGCGLPLQGVFIPADVSFGSHVIEAVDLVGHYHEVLELDEPQTVLVERILTLAEARMAEAPERAEAAATKAILEILSSRQRDLYRQYCTGEEEIPLP